MNVHLAAVGTLGSELLIAMLVRTPLDRASIRQASYRRLVLVAAGRDPLVANLGGIERSAPLLVRHLGTALSRWRIICDWLWLWFPDFRWTATWLWLRIRRAWVVLAGWRRA